MYLGLYQPLPSPPTLVARVYTLPRAAVFSPLSPPRSGEHSNPRRTRFQSELSASVALCTQMRRKESKLIVDCAS